MQTAGGRALVKLGGLRREPRWVNTLRICSSRYRRSFRLTRRYRPSSSNRHPRGFNLQPAPLPRGRQKSWTTLRPLCLVRVTTTVLLPTGLSPALCSTRWCPVGSLRPTVCPYLVCWLRTLRVYARLLNWLRRPAPASLMSLSQPCARSFETSARIRKAISRQVFVLRSDLHSNLHSMHGRPRRTSVLYGTRECGWVSTCCRSAWGCSCHWPRSSQSTSCR